MSSYKKQIHEYITAHKEDMIEFLSRLISYKSVMSEPADNMPFGKGCAEVLGEFLSECEKFGFKTKNIDNYAAHADMNDMPPSLGILCHLDVVPEGTGWTGDPYRVEIRGDKLFGRGAIDDKGPAAAALFAMKCVSDLNIPLKKGVRIIVGCNEENGSEDMEYYLRHEKFPEMLVTPDGNYPIINIEKGMLRCEISSDELSENIISIHGGSVINAVPELCEAVVRNTSADRVNEITKSINNVKIYAEDKGDCTHIRAEGVCAHASTPEQGVNAVTAMLSILGGLFGGKVKALAELFPFGETDGGSAGLKCSDEKSGELTLVLSVINAENGSLKAYCDSRFPVLKSLGEISSALCKSIADRGFSAEIVLGNEPHYVSPDSDFVRSLLAVYEDVTGEKGECIAIGGGTYVHDTDNGVAFGAEFPGEDNHMHGADEFIKLSSLLLNAEIYANMIARLCGEQ
ncbi:MAG: Sapep family Mn(2+)-dependent dipeptidase [Oscillospiraceae bacterium]